jgi:hypothetical protein
MAILIDMFNLHKSI